MDSFHLRDYKINAEVRYQIKHSVIKIHIKSVNRDKKTISPPSYRAIFIASGTFSLKDCSLIYMGSDCQDNDSFNKANELSILDLTFNHKLLNIIINCLEINKDRLTLKYFKSLLVELKEIKKEIGCEN